MSQRDVTVSSNTPMRLAAQVPAADMAMRPNGTATRSNRRAWERRASLHAAKAERPASFMAALPGLKGDARCTARLSQRAVTNTTDAGACVFSSLGRAVLVKMKDGLG